MILRTWPDLPLPSRSFLLFPVHETIHTSTLVEHDVNHIVINDDWNLPPRAALRGVLVEVLIGAERIAIVPLAMKSQVYNVTSRRFYVNSRLQIVGHLQCGLTMFALMKFDGVNGLESLIIMCAMVIFG